MIDSPPHVNKIGEPVNAKGVNGKRKSFVGGGAFAKKPVVPSQWSVLLRQRMLNDSNALNDPDVRRWVIEHWHKLYVPNDILDALGLKEIDC